MSSTYTSLQRDKIAEGLQKAGLQGGQLAVPVRISNLNIAVLSDKSYILKFCDTEWRLLGQQNFAPQPMPRSDTHSILPEPLEALPELQEKLETYCDAIAKVNSINDVYDVVITRLLRSGEELDEMQPHVQQKVAESDALLTGAIA